MSAAAGCSERPRTPGGATDEEQRADWEPAPISPWLVNRIPFVRLPVAITALASVGPTADGSDSPAAISPWLVNWIPFVRLPVAITALASVGPTADGSDSPAAISPWLVNWIPFVRLPVAITALASVGPTADGSDSPAAESVCCDRRFMWSMLLVGSVRSEFTDTWTFVSVTLTAGGVLRTDADAMGPDRDGGRARPAAG